LRCVNVRCAIAACPIDMNAAGKPGASCNCV